MIQYQGNFQGEIKMESMKFSKLFTKTVLKNNDSSGKILVPADLVDQEVVVCFPVKKSGSKKRKRRKEK